MYLHCVITPDDEETSKALEEKLDGLGCKHITDIYGGVIIAYEGACDEKLLAILAVLEEFGGNRLQVFEHWTKMVERNKRQIQYRAEETDALTLSANA